MPKIKILFFLRVFVNNYFVFYITVFLCAMPEITMGVISNNEKTLYDFLNNLMYIAFILSFCILAHFAWINTVFLSILYLTKISRDTFLIRRKVIIECIAFYVIFFLIDMIIDNIPTESKYLYYENIDKSGNIISRNICRIKIYYSDDFKLLYTYTCLFLFYLCKKLKHYTNIRNKKRKGLL